MSIFGIAFLSLISVMFVTTVGGLSLAIRRNFLTGLQFRQALAQRLAEVRLYSMLQRRGIEVSSYLHRVPANEIEREIRACAECGHKAECDRAQQSAAADQNFEFCPNNAALAAQQAG